MRPYRKPCQETSGLDAGWQRSVKGADVKVWTHEIMIKIAME